MNLLVDYNLPWENYIIIWAHPTLKSIFKKTATFWLVRIPDANSWHIFAIETTNRLLFILIQMFKWNK